MDGWMDGSIDILIYSDMQVLHAAGGAGRRRRGRRDRERSGQRRQARAEQHSGHRQAPTHSARVGGGGPWLLRRRVLASGCVWGAAGIDFTRGRQAWVMRATACRRLRACGRCGCTRCSVSHSGPSLIPKRQVLVTLYTRLIGFGRGHPGPCVVP